MLLERDIAVSAPPPEIDAEIAILPLGVRGPTEMSRLIFRPWTSIIPTNYSEEELKQISDFLWQKKAYKPAPTQFYIDFRELEHVY